jgi:hypothetical protein
LRSAAIIAFVFSLVTTGADAQRNRPTIPPADSLGEKFIPVDTRPQDHDANILVFPVRAQCKAIRLAWFEARHAQPPLRSPRKAKARPQKAPLLTVHGNINYDFDYWSSIDTPYAEKNINQQTLQTWLDLNYRNQYPFRVVFTTRWSNSSLFRNITDVSFQYNASQFNNKVKRQALNLLLQHYAVKDSLERVEKMLSGRENEFNNLNTWLNGPDQQQRLIAQREMAWLKARDTLPKPPPAPGSFQLTDWDPAHDYSMARHGSASADSGKYTPPHIDSTWIRRYDSLQKHLDSLGTQVDSLQRQYQRLQTLQKKGAGDLQHELDGVTSGKVLKDKLDSLTAPYPKGIRTCTRYGPSASAVH